ncbi:MAG TPA: CHAD domain-containing protein [Vicinamibacterales bacterium]|nr:CHAD domain-containing protein [Vicinamibacterales bacterium]
MTYRPALLTLLKQRLTALLDAMPAAQAGDTRSVHQARVATRRLREALPVVRASFNEQALGRAERQVRKMTRALGPVRELDVALAHLDELAARNVVSGRALSRLRQAIARERFERRRELLAAITPGKMERLRQRLGRAGEGDAAPQPAAAVDEAQAQTVRRAGRLAPAVERAGGLYLPDRLHAVRIATKKLRYALEIQRELKRSKSTARVRQLKRLQDLLGRMHDFEILIDRTRQVQADIAGHDRKLTLELDTIIRTLEAECRKDHATYMRRRSSILKLCRALAGADDVPAVA